MSGLAAIANKAPIVATFDTHTLHASIADVRNSYTWHAATYVEQPVLAELRQTFIEAVYESKTPKACLVAPFGYGKTATAIGIWSACQQAKLLAVPPISCGSFAALAQAVYDWLVFMLPDDRQEIASAYDRFLTGSAEALARRDEREFGIPFVQGSAAIRDKLERGYLDFEDVSVNLVMFFEQMTAHVRRKGYQGLVVIVDELQQLIGNANKGVLVALRQLIWGLRTRQIEFGLLLTIDPDTERTLADRAGDILHRIKDDGFYLDIRHIYDREFPARLWDQYTTALTLTNEAHTAIEHAALDALGQLCERDDLSNGPRTAINVLQLAALRRIEGRTNGYTPIDLVDDLLRGAIRFDGDRGVIPALVAELLSFPYFQRSTERSQVLKLIAAFPRGCPRQIAAMYGLERAWDELNDDLRGEIVTELDEGLALIELQRVGRPVNRLNMLLRRYWMQITDQQLFGEDAPRVFSNIVLPFLFPAKLHDLNGWADVANIQLSATGGYTGIIEGTSSSVYPLRRIAVSVVTGILSPREVCEADDIDLHIVFRLNLGSEARSAINIDSETLVEFNLAIGRPAEAGLRGGLAWIEHYLSPQRVSVAVILSLLHYLEREQTETIPERDQIRIADTVTRLREWLLAELLSQDLFRSAGFEVSYAGDRALKEFCHLFFARRWPQYQPLATYPYWMTLIDDYEAALNLVAPAIRVGDALATGTKAEVAYLFRQKRHAGFESRARQYGMLLQLEVWRGNEAAVRFKPLPAEIELANQIRSTGSLPRRVAYQHLRAAGFAAAESAQILRLILAHGLATQNEGDLSAPNTPTDVELMTRLQSLSVRGDSLHNISDILGAELDLLVEAIGQQNDAIRIVWRLDQIEQLIEQSEAKALAAAKARSEASRAQLLAALPRIATSLSSATSGELEHHLSGIRQKFDAERERLVLSAERFVALGKECPSDEADVLFAQIANWIDRVALYDRWNNAAQRLSRLQSAVERLRIESNQLKDLHARIEALIVHMRAVLAEHGIPALGEIGRFEATLIGCEQDFQLMENERQGAYLSIASDLCTQVCALVGTSHPPVLPAYDPTDDERSFQALFQAIATITSRSIALLSIQVSGEEGSKNEQRIHQKLRADIKTIARRAADPNWLIATSHLRLRKEAAKDIRAIHERLARESENSSTDGTLARKSLVAALSVLPPGPTDVSAVLAQVNCAVSHDEVLKELIRLQRAGVLRLMIDMPDEGTA